jgi:flagellar biosynthetic protein FliR
VYKLLDINQVALFFLILARLSALFVTAPLFSMANTPGIVKIGLALLISLITFPIIYQSMPVYSIDGWDYVFALVREVLVGLALGFTASLVLSALMFAGSLIDMQIGFSMSMIFDPMASAMSGVQYWGVPVFLV